MPPPPVPRRDAPHRPDPAFVPPFPERPTTRLPLPELLRRLRRNLLEVFHARQFTAEVTHTRLLARTVLICNSPATIEAVFLRDHAALERKTPQMRVALAPLVGDGLIISDGATWRARRPVAARAVHAARLPLLAPAMTAVAAARLAAWDARPPGAPVDMLAEMGEVAAEVIGRAVFGQALAPGDAAQVVAAFTAYQRRGGPGGLLSLLGLPDPVAALAGWRPRGDIRRIHAVLDRLVAAARAAPTVEATLIHAMATVDPAFSPRTCRNEAATLFLAGQETTATTLAWAWYLLSQDRGTAARLAAETRTTLAGRAATLADLPALPFTRAVLEETLRLYPPIPLLARQTARAITLAGRKLPRGSIVMVVPWLLHRNPTLWPDPDAFRPDRFLPPAPRPARHTFLPFSVGPRVCTGAAFAMAEAVIVLATLAQRFAPRLAAGAQVFPVCRLTLRPGETLPMHIDPA